MRPTKERLDYIRKWSEPSDYAGVRQALIREIDALTKELDAAKGSRDAWASAARAEAMLANDARSEANQWRERHVKLKEAFQRIEASNDELHSGWAYKILSEDAEYDK